MSAASFGRSRKVRTPQGKMPDNIRSGEPQGEAAGSGHRNRLPSPYSLSLKGKGWGEGDVEKAV